MKVKEYKLIKLNNSYSWCPRQLKQMKHHQCETGLLISKIDAKLAPVSRQVFWMLLDFLFHYLLLEATKVKEYKLIKLKNSYFWCPRQLKQMKHHQCETGLLIAKIDAKLAPVSRQVFWRFLDFLFHYLLVLEATKVKEYGLIKLNNSYSWCPRQLKQMKHHQCETGLLISKIDAKLAPVSRKYDAKLAPVSRQYFLKVRGLSVP